MPRGRASTDDLVDTVSELSLAADRTRESSSLHKSTRKKGVARTPASIFKKQGGSANGSRGLMSKLEGLSLRESTGKAAVRARAAINPPQRLKKWTVVSVTLTDPDVNSAAARILAALCADGITSARVHIPGGVHASIDLKELFKLLKRFHANPTITPNMTKITCRPATTMTPKLATQAEWLSYIKKSMDPPTK